MSISPTLPLRRRRERPRRAPAVRRRLHPVDARARRAGGPEDRALYHCHCGYHWTGAVTASVGCPHCGTPQAW